MLVIGLDVGGSTTKAVLFSERGVEGYTDVRASDPIASASGAVGKLLTEAGIGLKEIEAISASGGGANFIGGKILGLPVSKVEEVEGIGIGGCYLSSSDAAAVVSVGTGTAVVAAWRGRGGIRVKHVGGTGVGGGTLMGLGRLILNKTEPESILRMAEEGDLGRVDLSIGEIVGRGIGDLPPDTTASNFGKVGDQTRPEDAAIGIVNMISEVVGTVSYFAAKSEGLEDRIVLVGRLVEYPLVANAIIRTISLFGGRGRVPRLAAYATAIGAAKKILLEETFPGR